VTFTKKRGKPRGFAPRGAAAASVGTHEEAEWSALWAATERCLVKEGRA
jgi:hypothetical protein